MARRPASKTRLEAARERMYRELVFESAEHVFARRGFGAAGMQDIAAEAGISLKTLYATFPGKNELYVAIQEQRGAEFAGEVTAAIEGTTSPLEALERGVRAYVDFLVRHDDFLRIHLREGKAWGLRPKGGTAEKGWQQGVALFAAIVRQGMAEEIFHRGDAEVMAMMGIALMQVQLARYAEGVRAEDATALGDEILLQLRRLLCREQPDRRAA